MLEEYAKVKTTLQTIETEYINFEAEVVKRINDAKKEMKGVLTSPYLLPGLWAAMVPMMMPYMGGIIPPPFPGGPPSTIPGMIYLLLIFLDDWEELQHELASDDASDDDFDCSDQL